MFRTTTPHDLEIVNTMNSNNRVITTLSKLKIFLNIKCIHHESGYSKYLVTNQVFQTRFMQNIWLKSEVMTRQLRKLNQEKWNFGQTNNWVKNKINTIWR